MNVVTDAMREVLKKCEISIDGNIFSKELLIQAYAEFLSQTMEKRKHNVGVVLHSGSLCFDALIITYAAITNLMFNQTSIDDIVDSLNKGDIVLYGELKKARYVYEGIEDHPEFSRDYKENTYIKLHKDNGEIKYISKKLWRLIEPYNGTAKKVDGRGIRRKQREREDFLIEVLGMQTTDISSVIDTSTVLVMPKDEADEIIKGISIKFGDKEVKLLDLVTASYYTEDNEYLYGGNMSKSDPTLKVCAKISVARKLIFARNGKRHIGLIIMGQDMIERGESELPELINRKSLQYVYICSAADTGYVDRLMEENEEIEVFACTKDFLAENASLKVVNTNSLTEELKKQIEVVKEKENESVILYKAGIDIEKYRLVKKTLILLKRNQYESEVKDNFIIWTHSLLNLLMTAPFSLRDLRRYVQNNEIRVKPVEEKIAEIERWADEMPASICEEAYCIVNILKGFAENLKYTTPKELWLRDYLRNNTKKTVAVIVPKAYYSKVINGKAGYIPPYSRNVSLMTPGSFDNTRIYDVIIVLGDFEGKKFNAFNCNSAKKIISLLYDPEEKTYRFKKRKASISIKKWDKRSTLRIKNFREDEIPEDNQVQDLLNDENEIDNYVSQIDTGFDVIRLNTFTQGSRTNMTTEIIAVATFSDESKAFFSRHYMAYILDSDKGLVREVSVPELNEGDSVVFTKNNNETKDIVDSILRQMIIDGKIGEKIMVSYEKSKEWRQCLIDYMENNNFSPQEVVNKMLELKVPVQEPTINRWLDEDTHTVGPRSVDSLKAIGKLTKNTSLAENSEVYFEACRDVRRIRRRILREIGNAIISKLSGKHISDESEFAEVYKNVGSLAEVLQIERITRTEIILPLNVANRPISI